ncbi:hypothetical protein K432DRAFT_437179 [Lepidopterella palustris CBS 459.81]|uniref:NACHT domain-containing protein n=1 Tax=Lepidopterella palustris CBS 459.81 TaxID=1314670 RepID=A0A8E2E2I7_9PEZI|nr:hypothetical protein K432DRAFT_437179 [Lepidopterella palustris CBS 459.81]
MLKSIKKRLSKPKPKEVSSQVETPQPSSEDAPTVDKQPQPATTTPATSPPQTQRYGLFPLCERKPTNQSVRESFDVDIVAIHGLNGDAYTSWKHENGILWLKDLLPETIPGSRIFTYGYPSQLFFSNSMAGIRDYSQRLLSSLSGVRDEDTERPIIFVCHSLGGIVCKQAIILAHEDDGRYGDILAATYAIIFLGTPHKGASGTTDIGKVVGNIINACLYVSGSGGFAGTTRTDLLNTLSSDSEALKTLATSFRNRSRNLEIVTFYETETTPPFTQLIVDKPSAIMDLPNEDIVPLFANHLNMCRYDGATQEYDVVSKALKRLARKAHLNRQARKRATSESSDHSLNETERSCMVLFNASDVADYKAELPRRVEGTCRWILEHPNYVSWGSEEETTLLWITGDSGCGKTILSAYLMEYLGTAQTTQPNALVCCFFCDDKIATQRDANAILRSIIYQILRCRLKLIRHVKAAFEIQGSHLVNSFETLWNIFIAIISDQKSGPVNIIVDAIDECEKTTRNRFLDAVTNLVHKAKAADVSLPNCIKFIITSRPDLSHSYNFNYIWKNRLPIEESKDWISNDVRLFIARRIDEIAKRSGCRPSTKEILEQKLYSKADNTFLWVSVVLQCLEESLLASEKDFQKIIDSLPPDLETLYENFLAKIPSHNQDLAVKILHILVGSSRYLTLEEISAVLAIDDSHRTVADVEADCQPLIRRTIQGILGPLVRISESKVSLLHQSAKEFLVDLATHSENPLASIYGVNQEKASMILASSCVSYLLLQDFVEDQFLPEYPSSENSSTTSSVLGRFAIPNEEMPFDPLALDEDAIFKDENVVEAEACKSISDRYTFFDYSATYWGSHFSSCDKIAPKHLQDAVARLIEKKSCRLFNWLKYFWRNTSLGFRFPEDFDSLTVASFFNYPVLLERVLKDYALFWAARMGCEDTVEILLKIGAEPNSRTHGHYHVVKLLLADDRRSSLSLAAGNGHVHVVELLLSHEQSRPDDQDDNQWTPLIWAVGGNHLNVVRTLLNGHRVNINHADKTGRTAFSWAAGDGFTDLAKYLFKHPQLEPNLPGGGRTEIIEAFAKRKRIDLSSKDAEGRNIISWACSGGHAQTLKSLIRMGCPGIDDEDSLDTVETLVSSGLVDIERTDRGGRTALTWAAVYGYLDVVQNVGNGGSIPLSLAKAYGHADVIQELEAWMAIPI